ncbi:hypothetical protein [Pseudomonas eucalypticola]|uniref:Lipoprotein n=1 Tax=Pseudomonas eucalypticola TaxID=2599595 RepID=A0A7D5HEF8_9PSED|nr:hypothetical protein [Pseudomonas eucalypticola]QKZ03326.1 hypothetical protein HWQ56_05810 [Pseudomonas eucalypticola]
MNLRCTSITLIILASSTLGLAGCQVMKPTPDDLKSRAQTSIGKPVTKISNVRDDSSTTYFTANTATAEYSCELPSGAMVALGSMGMGMGAQCTKQ